MYRAPPPPPPPVDARGVVATAEEDIIGLGDDSSDDKVGAGRGLKDKQERLERAARLLQQQHAATS